MACAKRAASICAKTQSGRVCSSVKAVSGRCDSAYYHLSPLYSTVHPPVLLNLGKLSFWKVNCYRGE